MGEWNIYIDNLTGAGGLQGKEVEIMLFQTLPDPLTENSYSGAWKRADIQYPGKLGPIKLPTPVTFHVLDEVDGMPRETGPFNVEFGQIVDVKQTSNIDAPNVKVNEGTEPKGQIKVSNDQNSVKALEMALYKSGKKIVSYKNVEPGMAVYLAIAPVIYIANVEGHSIKEGDDFKSIVQASKSTKFTLYPDVPDVKIGIKKKKTGLIEFVKVD